MFSWWVNVSCLACSKRVGPDRAGMEKPRRTACAARPMVSFDQVRVGLRKRLDGAACGNVHTMQAGVQWAHGMAVRNPCLGHNLMILHCHARTGRGWGEPPGRWEIRGTYRGEENTGRARARKISPATDGTRLSWTGRFARSIGLLRSVRVHMASDRAPTVYSSQMRPRVCLYVIGHA
jgi:hypothetical protein